MMSVQAVDQRLLRAATHGRDEDVKRCIEEGADVNVKNPYFCGWTPLHLAAVYGQDTCCKTLIAAGCKINPKDEEDWTPLHRAAVNGQDTCCKTLIAAGCKINEKDHLDDTPLHLSCRKYNYGGDEFYKVIFTFLQSSQCDPSIKNRDGLSAFDQLDSVKRRRVEREYERYLLHRKIMASGSRPADVVKVFLCGDPAAGKTTLKRTLTKQLSVASRVKSFLAGSTVTEEEDEEGGYQKTPGIDVEKKTVRGVGKFMLWDCAGQIEYSVTHGMFMGTAQSIFIVVYDILRCIAGNKSTTKFWLPFIKSSQRQSEWRPHIILIATHSDRVSKQAGLQAAGRLLRLAKDQFAQYMDIDDNLILMDARDDSSDLDRLKNILKSQRKEIIGTQTLPKSYSEILKKLKPWREEAVPIMGWSEFLKRFGESYKGMDDDLLRSLVTYLHIMGDVYWAKLPGKDDQIVVNTQWFTSQIIGSVFAGTEFAGQQNLLPPKAFYTLPELRNFFTEKIETTQLLSLLNHMDLVHETDDERFLIPGKLPTDAPDVTWDAQKAYAVKGVSLECKDDTDILNPSIFPCIQKQVLDKYKASTVVSRNAIKSTPFGGVTVFVRLAKHKEAIHVAVMYNNEKSLKAAHEYLQNSVSLIETELFEKSPGTNLKKCYISHADLRKRTNLEDVASFSEEALVGAEKLDGMVRKDAAADPEDTADILFQGFDSIILRNLGSTCRYEWLPVDASQRCFERLDVIHEWLEDYRSVASILGFAEHEREKVVEQTSRQQLPSVTCNLIKRWCEKNEKKMTIGMLATLLTRMGLEDNADALDAIKEVIQKYPVEGRKPNEIEGEEGHYFAVPEHLVTWRRVLKRKRDIILADMDPSDLTSTLHYLPLPMCKVLENTKLSDVEKRMNNVKTLMLYLLESEKENWPIDLLAGLQDTGQSPLAQTLKEEYAKILSENGKQRDIGRRDMSDTEYETESLSEAKAAATTTTAEAPAGAGAAAASIAETPAGTAPATPAGAGAAAPSIAETPAGTAPATPAGAGAAAASIAETPAGTAPATPAGAGAAAASIAETPAGTEAAATPAATRAVAAAGPTAAASSSP